MASETARNKTPADAASNSALNAGSLFTVDGLVAFITGGGSGEIYGP
jgi:hypothetical protein